MHLIDNQYCSGRTWDQGRGPHEIHQIVGTCNSRHGYQGVTAELMRVPWSAGVGECANASRPVVGLYGDE
jgi:hypothetical protein